MSWVQGLADDKVPDCSVEESGQASTGLLESVCVWECLYVCLQECLYVCVRVCGGGVVVCGGV